MFDSPFMAPKMVHDAFKKAPLPAAPTTGPTAPAAIPHKGKQPDHHKAKRHLFHALQALNGKNSPDPDAVP